ncbi:hypothetical protein [Paenibacillus sp. MMS20-IR301]|uniref:hypothetical protein n=1 Tax=Paenibacillus sp. MMS20-IR301 TaxID=2895946 RepID=UPI0028ED2015|nr:hypothetical protein [Paenibacillus sp. MMS20-IR301]WNS46323.1 hypothetical protein LOS79_14000 [Paenibacillus sp. MMS20-IR301]
MVKKQLISLLFIIVLSVSGISTANAETKAVYPTDHGPRQSAFAAPAAKPGLKWAVPFDGDIEQVVIDSAGILYVLSDNSRELKLTAVQPGGKLLWSKVINGSAASGLYLYNDKYLIVSGTLDTQEVRDKSEVYQPSGILSKYTISGELVWENIYEDTHFAVRHSDLTVDETDGFIAFAATLYSTAKGSSLTKEEVRLIGVSADGKTQFNTPVVASTDRIPVYYSNPLIVKGNIYLSSSKGYYRPYSKRAEMAEFDDARFMKYNKQGKLLSSTDYKGIVPYAPVYYNNHFYLVGEPYNKDNNLYIINTDGKLTKKISVKRGFIGSELPPSISKEGNIVFGQRVYDPSGKLIWSFLPASLKEKVYRFYPKDRLTIDSKQNILFTSMDNLNGGNGITSINMISRKVNWYVKVDSVLDSPVVIGKDGTVYVWGTKLFAFGS